MVDLFDALEGFNELEDQRNDLAIVRTRKTIAWLVNIHLKQSDRVTENQIWPLEIDKGDKPPEVTVEVHE